MKTQQIMIVLIFSSIILGCLQKQDCPENINILPMYGEQRKCNEQIQADKEFIAMCDTVFNSRNEAVMHHLNRGWKYFYKNQFDTAMMRFNQAWLLDSTNADIYWGFGNILGKQSKFKESLIYFAKSLKLNSKNSNVWYCSGLSYGQLFYQTKDIGLLNKAIDNFKMSVSIDPKNVNAYGQLTASYSYFIQKDSGKKYLKITDKLDPSVVNPEVRQILESK